MSNLSILKTSIRTYESLYSLNDLHQASGNDPKHRPTFFIKNQQTQELIAEIQCENSHTAIKVINGGLNRGTYACEELALSYAMWISPKFHLVVLRAFIAMHKGELQNQQQTLPLVEERKYTFEHTKEQGLRLVSLWHATYRMAKILGELEPALSMLGSTFAPMAHSCSKEYQITLTLAHKELTRMLDGVEVSPRENAHFYKVLSDLRQWQPKGYLRKIS